MRVRQLNTDQSNCCRCLSSPRRQLIISHLTTIGVTLDGVGIVTEMIVAMELSTRKAVLKFSLESITARGRLNNKPAINQDSALVVTAARAFSSNSCELINPHCPPVSNNNTTLRLLARGVRRSPRTLDRFPSRTSHPIIITTPRITLPLLDFQLVPRQ